MPKDITIIKSVPFEYGVIELRSDNILTYEPHEGLTTFTRPHLELMLEILLELSDGKPMPYFSNNYNLKSLDSEERLYIKKHIHRFASKFAMTENSPMTRFITHTFMQLSRPSIPVKMFKTKEEAFAWLNED
ncbi:MAG: hypothetical protein H6587_10745 [Flavobacteriales bacterium]|nr:hypothetical protein [Flavobacteriales bacterium]MCB9365038.1 hypothetical protein [Flavobacteriales bacterium]